MRRSKSAAATRNLAPRCATCLARVALLAITLLLTQFATTAVLAADAHSLESLAANVARLRESGRADEALLKFNAALKSKPTAELYLLRGNAHFAKLQVREAAKDYTEALRLIPMEHGRPVRSYMSSYVDALCSRGSAYAAVGRIDLANADLAQALKINPREIRAMGSMGINLLRNGRVQEAHELFDKAVQIDPKSAIAWNNRGNALKAMGKIRSAMQDWTRAIELDSTLAIPYLNRGQALANLGHYKQARADIETCIRLMPRFALAYNNRGYLELMLEAEKSAMDDFDKALSLDPTLAMAHNNRGSVFAGRGDYRKAIECYSKALQFDRSKAEMYNNRGLCYQALGQFAQAEADLQEALRRAGPKSWQAWNNLALLYHEAGKGDKAMTLLDTAIKLNPLSFTSLTNRGTIHLALGDTKRALDDFNKAIEINDRFGAAYANRARVFAKQKKAVEALSDFDRALALDVRMPGLLEERGKVAYNAGQIEQAVIDLSAVRKSRSSASAGATTRIAQSDLEHAQQVTYDGLVAGYDKLIVLRPAQTDLRLSRGTIEMGFGRYARAADDFQTIVKMEEPASQNAKTAAILLSLSWRALKKNGEADALVKKSVAEETGDGKSLQALVLSVLSGKASLADAEKRAADKSQQTALFAYLGLNDAFSGRIPEARKHLSWVEQNGDRSMDEYFLATSELKRIGKR